MKHVLPLLLVVLVAALGACNKPSEANCKKALANMRTLLGTDSAITNTDTQGDVRRCVGGSNKKSVECAVKATTREELYKCDFIKPPKDTPGTAAPSAGTAAGTGAGTDTATPSPGTGAGTDTPAPSSGTAAPASGTNAPAPSSGTGAPAPSSGTGAPAPSSGTGAGTASP